jgi:hypothetical protein
MSPAISAEIAAAAARLVVEDGMEYAAAKRKAARALGRRGAREVELPTNEQVEDEVRAHLDLYCAETQPAELRALRELALDWMARLAEFRPYLGGAVWRGTATRLSAIRLDLYCDDAKSAEIALLNRGVRYDVHGRSDKRGGPSEVLSIDDHCAGIDAPVTVLLSVLDHDDLRGALKPDSRGLTSCGDLAALRRLMASEPGDPA